MTTTGKIIEMFCIEDNFHKKYEYLFFIKQYLNEVTLNAVSYNCFVELEARTIVPLIKMF